MPEADGLVDVTFFFLSSLHSCVIGVVLAHELQRVGPAGGLLVRSLDLDLSGRSVQSVRILRSIVDYGCPD